jgi:hypothetical protein
MVSVFSAILTSMAFNYHHQLIAVGTRIQPTNQYNMNTFEQPPLPYSSGPSEYHAPSYAHPDYNPYEGTKPPGYQSGGYEERDIAKDRSAFDSDDDEDDKKAHGPKVNP